MREPTIFAMGGYGLDARDPVDDFILDLGGKKQPRLLFVATATGDKDDDIVRFYDAFGERARVSHLKLFDIPPPDLRRFVLRNDVIFVGGGNTASMLAVWQTHGVDAILRDAWERGIPLVGVSAGAICWFEAGVTDSFREELDGMECLGFLRGSNCPHYDGEEARRPAYHRLVAAGFPPGHAADDACALHFVGEELADVVAGEAGKRAYRVELVDGAPRETPLEKRVLMEV